MAALALRFSFLFRACLRCYQWKLWLMQVAACFRNRWPYQCIGIGKREKDQADFDWLPISFDFIAMFIASRTISQLSNLSHSFQLVATWFGQQSCCCCVETFLALWCCHKSHRFPLVLFCCFHCNDAWRVCFTFFIFFFLRLFAKYVESPAAVRAMANILLSLAN